MQARPFAVAHLDPGDPLGLAIHPEAIRRDRLTARFRQLLQRGFGDRVLPFDHQAAGFCAEIRAARRRAGAPIATEAAMIAAIARQNGTNVATRDAGGFAGCGVVVIDPWQG